MPPVTSNVPREKLADTLPTSVGDTTAFPETVYPVPIADAATTPDSTIVTPAPSLTLYVPKEKIACTADGDTATPVPSTAVTLLTAPAIDKELMPPAFHAPWFQPALPQPVPKIIVTEDMAYANLIMALFASLAGY
jgi:hypothetical protein